MSDNFQFSISCDGEEITVNIFSPPCYFPIIYAINNIKNSYNFEALTDVELVRAPKEKVIEFIKKDPDILYDLTVRLGIKLYEVMSLMESYLSGCADRKVLMVLFNLSKRFGRASNGQIIIDLPIVHKNIASMIGLTRETVARHLSKFHKEGLITQSGRLLIITDMKKIEEQLLLIYQNERHIVSI